MDSSLLVTNGYRALDILDVEGIRPRAAIWVYDDEDENWRLWLVPEEDGPIDRFAFYKRMWEILRAHPDLDMTEVDVRAVEADHPGIIDFGHRYDVRDRSSQSFSHTMLGNTYAAKGIILRMAMQERSDAA